MRLFVGAVIFGASIATALAQGTDEQRGACMGDAFRLCGSFIPDETAIEKCLEGNLPNLTPACKVQFTTPTPPPSPPPKGRKPR